MSERPTFDEDGYPTEQTLDAIRTWDYKDWSGLIEFIATAMHRYGVVRKKKSVVEFVTGGWSGNEECLGALRSNVMIFALYWESSHRGGMEVYRLAP
jgi:hypothetical protein